MKSKVIYLSIVCFIVILVIFFVNSYSQALSKKDNLKREIEIYEYQKNCNQNNENCLIYQQEYNQSENCLIYQQECNQSENCPIHQGNCSQNKYHHERSYNNEYSQKNYHHANKRHCN